MKIARTIGLAVLAAMALMASLGVGSASAWETTLCKTAAESPVCKSENRYATGTTFKATSSSVTFKSSAPTVTCTSSTLEGKTLEAAGAPQDLSVTSWSLGECYVIAVFKFNCTATPNEGAPYAATLARTSPANGDLATGKAGWFISCPSVGIKCTVTLTSSLQWQGGVASQIVASDETMGESGSCPEQDFKFSGTYTVGSPNPAHIMVTSPLPPTTALCKQSVTYCEPSSLYPIGTQIQTKSASFTFYGIAPLASSNVVCSEASMQAPTTTATYGEPLPVSGGNLSFKGCEIPGTIFKVSCSIEAIGDGNDGIRRLSANEASLWMNDGAKWSLQCAPGSNVYCTIEAPKATAFMITSESVSANFLPVTTSGGTCNPKGEFSASFPLVSPKPLYFTNVRY